MVHGSDLPWQSNGLFAPILSPVRDLYKSSLQLATRQNTGPVVWWCAAAVKLCQQLLLLGHLHRTARAGQVEGFRPGSEVLDQGFCMAAQIQHPHRPERSRLEEVFTAEVKERDLVAHARLYVGDQRHDMGDRNLVMRVQAAAIDAPRSLYDPDMLAQLSAVEINLKLLRPEDVQGAQAIDALTGEAVVPAIDKPHGLGAPAPVRTRANPGIHSSLYSIEITYLLEQRLVVDAAHVRFQRAKQHRDARAHGMHCAFAEVKEAGEVQWRQVGRIGIVLHLLVATCHRVRARLRNIIERQHLQQVPAWMLAQQEQDVPPLAMVELYSTLQTSARMITATGLVAYTRPEDARIIR